MGVENLTPPGFNPWTVQATVSHTPVRADIIQGDPRELDIF